MDEIVGQSGAPKWRNDRRDRMGGIGGPLHQGHSPRGGAGKWTHMRIKDHELTFNAIDVETANEDRSSICQIGIAHVSDGRLEDTWKSLIDPEDWFDPWNVEIHGITEGAVKSAPTLPEVREELRRRLWDSVLVSHTYFDRVRLRTGHGKVQFWSVSVLLGWTALGLSAGHGLTNTQRRVGGCPQWPATLE